MRKLAGNRYDLLFILVLLTGAIMRFWNYAGWSLSNDELSALARLQYSDFSAMIEEGVRKTDMHPIGVQAFLWFWTHAFGLSEQVVRLPFVLMGIGSLVFFYLATSRIFGKAPALYASAMMAALGFPVLYSQLARPYSPGLFFTMMMTLGWAQLLFPRNDKDNPDWYSWFLFIAGGAGCMYSHYFSFLQAALIGLSGLFLIDRNLRLKYVGAGILMFLIYIPNYNVFMTQFGIGGLGGAEGWLGPPGKDAVWQYLVYAFGESSFLLVVTLVFAIASWLISGKPYGLDLKRKVILLLFAIPVLIAYYYSVFGNPVFQYSILLFSFPFLLMLLFSWVNDSGSALSSIYAPLLVLGLTLSFTVFVQGFYSKQFFAPFRDVASRMLFYHEAFGKDKTDLTVNVINPWYIHYYSDRLDSNVHFLQYIANKPEQWERYRQLVDSSDAENFIHGWCNNYHAPELDMITREKFPHLIASDTFFNAGVRVYSRSAVHPALKQADTLFAFITGYEEVLLEGEEKWRDSTNARSGRFALHIFPETEYGPTLRRSCGETGLSAESTFELSCDVFPTVDLREATAVVSINHGDQTWFWRGVKLNEFTMTKGMWNRFYMALKMTDEIPEEDMVSVYIYNPGKESFLIDNFSFLVRE